MSEGPYVLGIDYGTESVWVGIFDLEDTPVVFAAEAYPLKHPYSGWAEQDPDEWWRCLVKATRRALDEGDVPREDIAGLSVDATTCTVVALDRQNRILRPAIMWMDVRAVDQAVRVQETEDPALKYNGFARVSAEWMPSKALWLKEREPDTYENAGRICECLDWITHRLTGEWTASINTASFRWYYDRNEGGFPESLYGALGLDDLLDKFPSRVLDMGTVASELRKEVAEELGLPAGLPVAEGGGDAFIALVGLNVLEPRKMALITGSSHVVVGQAAEPRYGAGFFGAYTDGVVPGQYSIEGGQASTGSVVKWFKDNFAKKAGAEAERRGVDPYEVLGEMAARVPPGSEELMVLDYWQGNRTPHTDPEARGMMWGLSLRHEEGHAFRAILEGICYGTEQILRTMRENGFEPKEGVVCGGPTKSDLWMQMHADVSNLPISSTRVPEAPTLGSAMLGAVGAGLHPNIHTAAENMVHVESQIEPDPAMHEAYKFFVDKYIETYPRMKELMHEVSRHVAGQELGNPRLVAELPGPAAGRGPRSCRERPASCTPNPTLSRARPLRLATHRDILRLRGLRDSRAPLVLRIPAHGELRGRARYAPRRPAGGLCAPLGPHALHGRAPRQGRGAGDPQHRRRRRFHRPGHTNRPRPLTSIPPRA